MALRLGGMIGNRLALPSLLQHLGYSFCQAKACVLLVSALGYNNTVMEDSYTPRVMDEPTLAQPPTEPYEWYEPLFASSPRLSTSVNLAIALFRRLAAREHVTEMAIC